MDRMYVLDNGQVRYTKPSDLSSAGEFLGEPVRTIDKLRFVESGIDVKLTFLQYYRRFEKLFLIGEENIVCVDY